MLGLLVAATALAVLEAAWRRGPNPPFGITVAEAAAMVLGAVLLGVFAFGRIHVGDEQRMMYAFCFGATGAVASLGLVAAHALKGRPLSRPAFFAPAPLAALALLLALVAAGRTGDTTSHSPPATVPAGGT
jgi:hypothetical protein